MAWISRLKDSKYLINFDEGRVYHGETIVAEISSALYIRILEHMSLHPEQWLQKNSIIENCWPDSRIADSTFYSTISKLKCIHQKVEDSIESQKGQGYRYHGKKRELLEESPTPPPKDPLNAHHHFPNENEEDRIIVFRAMTEIKMAFPDEDLAKLYDDIVRYFLDAAKIALAHYDSSRKAHEIFLAYYAQRSAEPSESIIRT